MTEQLRIRREFMRWILLLALNNAREAEGCSERLLAAVVGGEFADVSAIEIRRELDYLFERDLIHLNKSPDGRWHADINRNGIDVVEYTVDCDPGISRPKKYWG
jgi:hypothetical protein